METINWTEEREVRRAIAIRQYRFLLRMEKLAREKNQYSLATECRLELQQLRLAFNL